VARRQRQNYAELTSEIKNFAASAATDGGKYRSFFVCSAKGSNRPEAEVLGFERRT
jgi:hypothetical protein